ncbi:MAG: twin-arginine translocase TatA/TatE family subunit [Candidatus Bathyarchaeia archaeon]
MAFLGPWEIALILVVVLVLFGPKKLPELAKGIGDAMRQYKLASEGLLEPTQNLPTTPDQATPRARSGDTLITIAKQLGIATEGKTGEQISKEVVMKATGKGLNSIQETSL